MKNTFQLASFFILLLCLSQDLKSQDLGTIPDSKDMILKGIELHEEGLFEEALLEYQKVNQNDPNYLAALVEQGISLTSLERYEEVIENCQIGLDLDQRYQADFYASMTNAEMKMGNEQKALETANKGIEIAPYSNLLYYQRALVKIEQGQRADAVLDLQESIGLDPFHALSHKKLADLALLEQQLSEAIMAMGLYLLLDFRNDAANEALAEINNAVSKKYQSDATETDVSPGEDFEEIDLLLKNYIALDEKFEVPSKIPIPIVKQSYLLFERADTSKSGFWCNTYLKFYKKMLADNQFGQMSNLMVLSSRNVNHVAQLEKQISKIQEFIPYFNVEWRDHCQARMVEWEGKQTLVDYVRHDGQLVAIGPLVDDEPEGFFKLIHDSGTFAGSGKYKKGVRVGKWTFLYPNGKIREEVTYNEQGQAEGNRKTYFENGNLESEETYQEGELQGLTSSYDYQGTKYATVNYAKGKGEGEVIYYHSNGQKRFTVDLVNDKKHGEYFSYFDNGQVKESGTYVQDVLEGPVTEYFMNGQLKSKSEFAKGKREGAYESYFQDGSKHEIGQYSKDNYSGAWKTYRKDGSLRESAEYDENGKKTGLLSSFYENEQKQLQIEYKKGSIVSYKCWDKSGKLLKESNARSKQFWFEKYFGDGVLASEGSYQDDSRSGEWKYYNDYGVLSSTESYEDQQINGIANQYNQAGDLSSQVQYIDGLAQGAAKNYHPDGSVAAEFYYLDDLLEGQYTSYSVDGTILSNEYYLEGLQHGVNSYFNEDGSKWLEITYYEDYPSTFRYFKPDGTLESSFQLTKGCGTISPAYPNGQAIFTRSYLGGRIHGVSSYYYPDGQLKSQLENSNGISTGVNKKYFRNGQLQSVGEYAFGLKEGLWTSYYEDGTVEDETNYKNGATHGESKRYWKNGQLLASEVFKFGKLEGEQRFFAESGELQLVRFYSGGKVYAYSYLGKDGKLVEQIPIGTGKQEIKSYYQNGQLAREYTFVDGIFIGTYKKYHPNGQLASESENVKGLSHGPTKTYYDDGSKKQIFHYKWGQLDGSSQEYYANGKLKEERSYISGELNGTSKIYNEDGSLKEELYYFGDLLFEIK